MRNRFKVGEMMMYSSDEGLLRVVVMEQGRGFDSHRIKILMPNGSTLWTVTGALGYPPVQL
jgi:hypothetical protein